MRSLLTAVTKVCSKLNHSVKVINIKNFSILLLVFELTEFHFTLCVTF